jgi:hypothetical protein
VRRSFTAAAVTLLLALVGGVGSAGAQETPSAALDRGDAKPGGSVEVTGRSWPDGVVVQVQVCGNEALNGSVDCDRAGAMTIGVGSDGLFSIQLQVPTPPKPCPCVVLITSPDLIGTVLRLPIEVAGVPTAPPAQDRSSIPVFSITRLRITKEQPLAALFGASHERTLVMTVENLGGSTIEALPITIAEADHPDEVIAAREMTNLPPGDRREVRIDFPVSALTFGSTALNVTVDQSGQALASTTSFSVFPWALLAVMVAVLLVGLVLWRMRRRRRQRRNELVEAIAEPESGAPADASGEIDVPRSGTAARHSVEPGSSETTAFRRPTTVAPDAPPAQHYVSRASEATLSDDLARLIAITLRDIGSIPLRSDTDALAERMAIVIVSELRAKHDFDPSAAVALTASITDELARELRQAVASPT